MSRAIKTCHSCRHRLLDTFAALAGVSIHNSPRMLISPAPTTVNNTRQNSTRTFSTSTRARDAQTQPPPSPSQQQDQTTSPNPDKPSTTASIPWYLQVTPPTAPATSPRLHALEDIPPIPASAPPILHPILTHLSTTIGLDNLSLLDLRSVHPPPALGSNLLMILGTARSYKHLNTSADRFCRWLRSRYKLAPYADGLLGRNEMKLKLRRRARRLKLAQSVGNTVAMGATEGGDDGITTGWVCVNVGAVDGVDVEVGGEGEGELEGEGAKVVSHLQQEELAKDEEEYMNPPDDSEVIGFGSRDARPRIVVQMFLEEKRIEMDLEGLWDFRVQRRERKEEKMEHRR